MEDDGATEDGVQRKGPVFLGRAGWLKRATGRLLGNYKERFIHVEKTEVVVYENEDLKSCLERLDLDNYDRCSELKGPFRKNRLALIKAPRAGNKVHDIKFLAQTPEDKDAWIKAFMEGIDRAKNKIFDEVKVDEGNNLDHVTRTRPKGRPNRRPPTRVHMQEVANVSSDGILRLDLDVPDAAVPNGVSHRDDAATETTPKEAMRPPPMPPSKTSDAICEVEADVSADTEPPAEKKVLKPPMPPSKDGKPLSATSEEEPPAPPSKDTKPLSATSEEPPAPPSKDGKPLSATSEEPPAPPSKDAKPLSATPEEPPAPPSKDAKPLSTTSEEEPNQEDSSEKVPMPPSPPSKDAKSSAPPTQEPAEDDEEEEAGPYADPKNSPEDGTSPSKSGSVSGSDDNPPEAARSSPETPRQPPPAPPSKDKKPPPPVAEPREELTQSEELEPRADITQSEELEGCTSVEDNKTGEKESKGDMDIKENSISQSKTETESSSSTVSKEALPGVTEERLVVVTDSAESSTTTADTAGPEVREPSPEVPAAASSNAADKSCQLTTPTVTPERTKKSPGPPVRRATVDTAGPKVREPSPEVPAACSNAADKSCQLTTPTVVLTPERTKSCQLTTPTVVLTPERTKKSPGPPVMKRKPVKRPPPSKAAVAPADHSEPKAQPVEEETKMATRAVPQETNDNDAVVASPQAVSSGDSVGSPEDEETTKLPAEPKSELPAVFISLNDPSGGDPARLGALPSSCPHAEKREREEEKSVDSGQHSDDDGSEASESGGTPRQLEVDVSKDYIETPRVGFIQERAIGQAASHLLRPPIALKPTMGLKNCRSASVGDLLSETAAAADDVAIVGDIITASGNGTAPPSSAATTELESQVALEMEKTRELLRRVSQSQGGEGTTTPEELLTKAMEKLRKADKFLSEAKVLKESKQAQQSPSKRISW